MPPTVHSLVCRKLTKKLGHASFQDWLSISTRSRVVHCDLGTNQEVQDYKSKEERERESHSLSKVWGVRGNVTIILSGFFHRTMGRTPAIQ